MPRRRQRGRLRRRQLIDDVGHHVVGQAEPIGRGIAGAFVGVEPIEHRVLVDRGAALSGSSLSRPIRRPVDTWRCASASASAARCMASVTSVERGVEHDAHG